MTDKEQFLHMLQQLPDDSTFEDILYHGYVLQKVKEGEQAFREGRVTPHEEVRKIFLDK